MSPSTHLECSIKGVYYFIMENITIMVNQVLNRYMNYMVGVMKFLYLIRDTINSRSTTIRIPVFLGDLLNHPGQGGPDGNRSTSEEINDYA